MAITFIRSDGATTGGTVSMDIGTAGTDRLVTVIASMEGTNTALTDVTVDGKSCTLVKRIVNLNSIFNNQEMWYINESGLGSSNGVVNISIVGGSSTWATHSMLHTGVSQGTWNDLGWDDTSVATTTSTVTNIDCSTNGLVIAGWGNGQAGLTSSSLTSPLVVRQDGPDPTSADLFSTEGIETTQQTNKTYTMTWSSSANRSTGIVVTWDEAGSIIKQTHQMML